MRISAFLPVLVAASGLCHAVSAQEQPWLKDRRYREGMGIRAGNLELHPGVAAEAGYDSNYFQADRNDEEDIIPAVRLRVTPSFSVATLGKQRREGDGDHAAPPGVEFRGTTSVSYSELVAVSGNSADRRTASEQRHVAGDLGLKAHFLPERPWGGDVLGDFRRIMQATNDPDSNHVFNRDLVRLGAGVIWRPGGGVFDWRLGYEFRYNYFEDGGYRDLNNLHHYANTTGHWRFLPRSALLYRAELGYIHYTSPAANILHDSQPLRTLIGFRGLVTNRFALLALGGWGASFYRRTARNSAVAIEDFDGFIGQAEVKWFISPQPKLPEEGAKVGLSSVAAGFTRDFANNYLTDYYERNRAYLNFAYFLGGVLLVSAEAGYSAIYYPYSYFAGGDVRAEDFWESRIDSVLFAEYRFSNQFGVNTTLRYNTALEGDNEVPIVEGGDETEDLSFARFEAYLGVRWFL
ncbi:MAG: hypothetical protein JW751_22540 [Polyangiaceae bacterium]|nr:hypothetical protein [Polyangiaceae bacterium]